MEVLCEHNVSMAGSVTIAKIVEEVEFASTTEDAANARSVEAARFANTKGFAALARSVGKSLSIC